MVNLGYVPSDRPVPAPDLSFVRLFDDTEAGWQQRGQYAIWTGRSVAGASYRLLERIGQRVACIERPDGGPVLHKLGRGVHFMVEHLMGHWLAFDSDAIWLDTPGKGGRYALLAIGGAAGKPGSAVVDWTCPRCGGSINAHPLDIPARGFQTFLRRAEAITTEFNAQSTLRTCPHCQAVHPPMATQPGDAATPPQDSRS